MSILKRLVEAGDVKLVEATRQERERAYRFDLLRAQDVPCTSSIFTRRMEALNAAKLDVDLKSKRVTDRLNLRLTEPSADVAALLKAQDNLREALLRYSKLIRETRTQRKLHQRSCRK